MQVILLERIAKLGSPGEEVSVKRGFARNWLLPQKKAVLATAHNRAEVEKLRSAIETRDKSRRCEADHIATTLGGKRIFLERAAGENEQLYGSVRARDVELALKEQLDITLSKGQVLLESPIRQLGITSVRLSVHPEVTIGIEVNVARSQEEADAQAVKLDRARAKAAEDAERERLKQDEAKAAEDAERERLKNKAKEEDKPAEETASPEEDKPSEETASSEEDKPKAKAKEPPRKKTKAKTEKPEKPEKPKKPKKAEEAKKTEQDPAEQPSSSHDHDSTDATDAT